MKVQNVYGNTRGTLTDEIVAKYAAKIGLFYYFSTCKNTVSKVEDRYYCAT